MGFSNLGVVAGCLTVQPRNKRGLNNQASLVSLMVERMRFLELSTKSRSGAGFRAVSRKMFPTTYPGTLCMSSIVKLTPELSKPPAGISHEKSS